LALGHLLQKKLKLWKSTSDVDNIVIDIEEEIEVPEFKEKSLKKQKFSDIKFIHYCFKSRNNL
jgi:hypothetical protein